MSCAYCGQSGQQTKEHIWPKWLHNAEDYSLKYNAKAGKVLQSEQVIKDVCADCNNGPLSNLDSYAKTLHLKYFSKNFKSIKKIVFQYDFEKLTKWLLKLTYNSARAAGSADADLLRPYAPYIITPGCMPIFSAFTVSLMGELIQYNTQTGLKKTTELRWCRSGPIELTKCEAGIMIVRVAIINTWCFTIFVMRNGALEAGDEAIILPKIQGAILRPDNTPFRIPTIQLNAEGVLQHFQEKDDLYRKAVHNLSNKRPL